MPEPTTPNTIVPLTGDLVGAWGTAALNPNFLAIDGMLCGVQTLAFSSATTIALTTATGSITPSAGPFQSQNALLKLSGTLTGNVIIQFTQPGPYIIHNQCIVGNFYVQLAPSSGTGNAIDAPPGEKVTVFFDGSSMDYVDLDVVGSGLRLRGATAIPAWIASACTDRIRVHGAPLRLGRWLCVFDVALSDVGGTTRFDIRRQRYHHVRRSGRIEPSCLSASTRAQMAACAIVLRRRSPASTAPPWARRAAIRRCKATTTASPIQGTHTVRTQTSSVRTPPRSPLAVAAVLLPSRAQRRARSSIPLRLASASTIAARVPRRTCSRRLFLLR